jgi:hypothetical protein
MESAYKELLLKILSILEYRDKEEYVKNFEKMNQLEAMTKCIERLPKYMQDEIIAKKDSPEEIKKYVSQDAYIKELAAVSSRALTVFIQDMAPIFTNEEKEKVAQLFVVS